MHIEAASLPLQDAFFEASPLPPRPALLGLSAASQLALVDRARDTQAIGG